MTRRRKHRNDINNDSDSVSTSYYSHSRSGRIKKPALTETETETSSKTEKSKKHSGATSSDDSSHEYYDTSYTYEYQYEESYLSSSTGSETVECKTLPLSKYNSQTDNEQEQQIRAHLKQNLIGLETATDANKTIRSPRKNDGNRTSSVIVKKQESAKSRAEESSIVSADASITHRSISRTTSPRIAPPLPPKENTVEKPSQRPKSTVFARERTFRNHHKIFEDEGTIHFQAKNPRLKKPLIVKKDLHVDREREKQRSLSNPLSPMQVLNQIGSHKGSIWRERELSRHYHHRHHQTEEERER